MTDLTCGVDVGGTKIAAGLVDEAGRISGASRVPTPAGDARALARAVAGLVRGLEADLAPGDRITGVGVGAAGFVDRTRSRVLFAPNIAWRDEDLRSVLEEEAGLPVVVENDANAAAWGEFVLGAGRDVDDLLLVTVGTGVGGGLVLDGELYRGAFGVAAEIGHLRVVPGGLPCGCGNLGCWEQYASGSALVRTAREAVATGDPGSSPLLERAGGAVEAITGPMVTAAAHDGDPLAVRLVTDLGRWLGEGIASLTAVLDPAVAVVGGGVSESGDLFLDAVRQGFREQLTGRLHRPELEIRPAELGNDAGLIGAADLARQRPRT
ncbi:ROK family glucokinase [Nocardioides perillae]|uniref:Glucokinase n=1 Tax=Nocardioides perillae TaxID=1119534 RepID=A0A7Y9RWY0_9ACTN|nr:ROK family glucokinase [Nocardioides perillae]NYG56283.1 glucokinase [Nocardioides perillae]